jgi:hypothetical protein
MVVQRETADEDVAMTAPLGQERAKDGEVRMHPHFGVCIRLRKDELARQQGGGLGRREDAADLSYDGSRATLEESSL